MAKPDGFWGKILHGLGLDWQSSYVYNYIYDANMRAGFFISAMMILQELVIILQRSFGPRGGHGAETFYSTSQLLGDTLILTVSGLMLVSSILYVKGKLKNKIVGKVIQCVYAAVCITFGIIISCSAYERGEQLLTFVIMCMNVSCLLIWRPIVSFGMLTAAYVLFYIRISSLPWGLSGIVGPTTETTLNLIASWASTLMLSFFKYHKGVTHAIKDESLEKMNLHLSEISQKDDLTEVHNMTHFRVEAEKILNYVTTNKENVVFLFMDIENFKSFNEKYGFAAGNELLRQVAHTMVRIFHGSLVSRFSDDHFVVLTNVEGVMENIEELTREIAACQREVHLELKCGAYRPSGDEKDPILACDRARFACNSIKKHYDCHFRYYDKTLEDQFKLKQHVINNIDIAIENHYIKVYYQPVVSMKTGCVCGLEALARWQDPEYGLLPPGAFIDTLEEHRQIYKLDRYVIEQVCRDYRDSVDNYQPFPPVSINFSRIDFELCDMVGYLTALAKRFDVPKEFIDVEITETALSDQQSYLSEAITALQEAGYKVWLDDFGSGYSSLNSLKDYQFDVMKIDMKFLSGFGSNEKTMPILKNIVQLARQLSMVSLTEGVETQEQYDFLQSIGCDRSQGYLFSKPAPLEEFRRMVADGELKIADEYKNAPPVSEEKIG